MEEYGSCLVIAKDGEGKVLKLLLAESEDIQGVHGIGRCLISVVLQRRLNSQEIEDVLSPFGDKIKRWQPNYRMRSLTG